jgi:hypothetical protein
MKLTGLIFFMGWGVRLRLLATPATNGPNIPAPDDDDDCGAGDEMRTGWVNRETFPMPLCRPQIPHDMT